MPVDLDPALFAEADKLRAELDAIDQASENDEPSEEAESRRDEIENRLDEIESEKTAFTSEQKSQAGVIVTIGHNGKPVYHCGLVERGAKVPSTNGEESSSPEEEKEDLSAALLQDLTTQRTAALRAALSVRPDIALIAITHELDAWETEMLEKFQGFMEKYPRVRWVHWSMSGQNILQSVLSVGRKGRRTPRR